MLLVGGLDCIVCAMSNILAKEDQVTKQHITLIEGKHD